MRLFRCDSYVIVGPHIVCWEVRESPVQPMTGPKAMYTEVWLTRGECIVFDGDHSKALELAVTGRKSRSK